MVARLPRALLAACVGAMAGAASLMVAHGLQPSISFDLETSLPKTAKGFYSLERAGRQPFVWTRGRASLVMDGIDRRPAWTCTIRVSGPRADPAMRPVAEVSVDGQVVATRQTSNAFEDIQVPVPSRPDRRGLTLGLSASNTFRPGGGDNRVLGLKVARIGCEPSSAFMVPPRPAMAAAVATAAMFGAAAGLVGITAGGASAAAIVLAVAQAVPMAAGEALYSPYPARLPWLAAAICIVLVAGARVTERLQGRPLRNTARFVALFSAAAMYLELAGLFHPNKNIVDALFQAHRLDWVLSGRFFFSSLTPGMVEFPYGISLYLFAAPFAWLTADRVALLRIIVCGAEAASGLLLYAMVTRTWGDRLGGAIAVALFHLVPRSFGVIGAGNLPNAFGESLALTAVAGATLFSLRPAHWKSALVLTVVVTAAFVSHLSTFTTLAVTLSALAAFYALRAGPLRVPGATLAAVVLGALLLATVGYYGHFMDLYRAQGARVLAAATGPAATTGGIAGEARDEGAGEGRAVRSSAARTMSAVRNLPRYFGWPLVLLAAVGLWRLVKGRTVDRLSLALAAWGTSCLTFIAVGVLVRVHMRYYYAVAPAVVILAGSGASWAWRRNAWWRALAGLAMAAAVVIGVRTWLGWFQ